LIAESEAKFDAPGRRQPRSRSTPGIRADDAMADAARKTLMFQLRRVIAHEAGVREGIDIEELHDMRVAVRRMRAALRVFAPYLDKASFKSFGKTLRRLGAVLGSVRDLDVFRQKTGCYLDRLPVERQAELDPLLAQWEIEYHAARKILLDLINDEKYRKFKRDFAGFLRVPGAGAAPIISKEGAPLPYRVSHVLPCILLQGYASVRAFEGSMRGDAVPLKRYHQLRIASKGLRYTLEYFEEILGPDTKLVIDRMKRLQDHLGDLQDAVVTCGILRDHLAWGTWGKKKAGRFGDRAGKVIAPGAAAYLAARETEIRELVRTFPEIWEKIAGPSFRKILTRMVDIR
jgi:CHAD domain-containing protein